MVGHRWFGKTAVEVKNVQQWDNQDSTKTWSDNGEVRALVEAMIPDLEAIVAKNATLGVSEYLIDGEAALRSDDKRGLMVGLRIWNDEASLIVEIPLMHVLIAALEETKNIVGVDKNAQAAVTSIIALGRQLAAIGGVHETPATRSQSIPSRRRSSMQTRQEVRQP